MCDNLVLVRGGGDLATGTIHRLVQVGFRVIVLELPKPTVIRTSVAFAQCLFDGTAEVEGLESVAAASLADALRLTDEGRVPVLVDPQGAVRFDVKPVAVVDAILAKKNMGTYLEWAPVVIGLGPGFTAGSDVHAVVETNRGHHLGRVYYQGTAEPNTGIPGIIGGHSSDRIVRAPASGMFSAVRKIGDSVQYGDTLGFINGQAVRAPLKGTLRGLINSNLEVFQNMKIGDIDPRNIRDHCWTISDKARTISGGVLEALLHLLRMRKGYPAAQ